MPETFDLINLIYNREFFDEKGNLLNYTEIKVNIEDNSEDSSNKSSESNITDKSTEIKSTIESEEQFKYDNSYKINDILFSRPQQSEDQFHNTKQYVVVRTLIALMEIFRGKNVIWKLSELNIHKLTKNEETNWYDMYLKSLDTSGVGYVPKILKNLSDTVNLLNYRRLVKFKSKRIDGLDDGDDNPILSRDNFERICSKFDIPHELNTHNKLTVDQNTLLFNNITSVASDNVKTIDSSNNVISGFKDESLLDLSMSQKELMDKGACFTKMVINLYKSYVGMFLSLLDINRMIRNKGSNSYVKLKYIIATLSYPECIDDAEMKELIKDLRKLDLHINVDIIPMVMLLTGVKSLIGCMSNAYCTSKAYDVSVFTSRLDEDMGLMLINNNDGKDARNTVIKRRIRKENDSNFISNTDLKRRASPYYVNFTKVLNLLKLTKDKHIQIVNSKFPILFCDGDSFYNEKDDSILPFILKSRKSYLTKNCKTSLDYMRLFWCYSMCNFSLNNITVESNFSSDIALFNQNDRLMDLLNMVWMRGGEHVKKGMKKVKKLMNRLYNIEGISVKELNYNIEDELRLSKSGLCKIKDLGFKCDLSGNYITKGDIITDNKFKLVQFRSISLRECAGNPETRSLYDVIISEEPKAYLDQGLIGCINEGPISCDDIDEIKRDFPGWMKFYDYITKKQNAVPYTHIIPYLKMTNLFGMLQTDYRIGMNSNPNEPGLMDVSENDSRTDLFKALDDNQSLLTKQLNDSLGDEVLKQLEKGRQHFTERIGFGMNSAKSSGGLKFSLNIPYDEWVTAGHTGVDKKSHYTFDSNSKSLTSYTQAIEFFDFRNFYSYNDLKNMNDEQKIKLMKVNIMKINGLNYELECNVTSKSTPLSSYAAANRNVCARLTRDIYNALTFLQVGCAVLYDAFNAMYKNGAHYNFYDVYYDRDKSGEMNKNNVSSLIESSDLEKMSPVIYMTSKMYEQQMRVDGVMVAGADVSQQDLYSTRALNRGVFNMLRKLEKTSDIFWKYYDIDNIKTKLANGSINDSDLDRIFDSEVDINAAGIVANSIISLCNGWYGNVSGKISFQTVFDIAKNQYVPFNKPDIILKDMFSLIKFVTANSSGNYCTSKLNDYSSAIMLIFLDALWNGDDSLFNYYCPRDCKNKCSASIKLRKILNLKYNNYGYDVKLEGGNFINYLQIFHYGSSISRQAAKIDSERDDQIKHEVFGYKAINSLLYKSNCRANNLYGYLKTKDMFICGGNRFTGKGGRALFPENMMRYGSGTFDSSSGIIPIKSSVFYCIEKRLPITSPDVAKLFNSDDTKYMNALLGIDGEEKFLEVAKETTLYSINRNFNAFADVSLNDRIQAYDENIKITRGLGISGRDLYSLMNFSKTALLDTEKVNKCKQTLLKYEKLSSSELAYNNIMAYRSSKIGSELFASKNFSQKWILKILDKIKDGELKTLPMNERSLPLFTFADKKKQIIYILDETACRQFDVYYKQGELGVRIQEYTNAGGGMHLDIGQNIKYAFHAYTNNMEKLFLSLFGFASNSKILDRINNEIIDPAFSDNKRYTKMSVSLNMFSGLGLNHLTDEMIIRALEMLDHPFSSIELMDFLGVDTDEHVRERALKSFDMFSSLNPLSKELVKLALKLNGEVGLKNDVALANMNEFGSISLKLVKIGDNLDSVLELTENSKNRNMARSLLTSVLYKHATSIMMSMIQNEIMNVQKIDDFVGYSRYRSDDESILDYGEPEEKSFRVKIPLITFECINAENTIS